MLNRIKKSILAVSSILFFSKRKETKKESVKSKKVISAALLLIFAFTSGCERKKAPAGMESAFLFIASQGIPVDIIGKFYSEKGELLKNVEIENAGSGKSLKADNEGKVNLTLFRGTNSFSVKNSGSVLGSLRLLLNKNGQVDKIEKSSGSLLFELSDGNKSLDTFYFPVKDSEYKTTDGSGNENGFLNDYWGNQTYHDGIDIFRKDSTVYPEVFSAADGEVVNKYSSCNEGDQTGCNSGVGNTVVIKSYRKNGQILYFVYWHLSSVNPLLKVGRKVSHQDLIGRMGSTGSRGGSKKYGVHLHFKVQTSLEFEAWGYADKESIESNYVNPDKLGLIDRGIDYRSFYSIVSASESVQLGSQTNVTHSSLGNIKRIRVALKRDSETGNTPNENYYQLENEQSNTGSISLILPVKLTPASDWRIYLRDVESGIYNSSITTMTLSAASAQCTSGQVETQSCGGILNGTSVKQRTCQNSGQWGPFGTCTVSCNTGFHVENGTCAADPICTSGQLETQSCGVILNGTSVKQRTCQSSGQWGPFGTCTVSCNTGFHVENGACAADPICTSGQVETQSCGFILNGTSVKQRTCQSSGQWGPFGNCNVSCNTGYHLENGVCVLDGSCNPGSQEVQGCFIANGTGSQSRTCQADRKWTAWGTCQLISCYANYHIENSSCVYNEKTCGIPNGTGKQYWMGTAWGSCILYSCNAGYIQSGSTCVIYPALEITSGSLTYGSMTTFPYSKQTVKIQMSVVNSDTLRVDISKTDGTSFTTSGTYYIEFGWGEIIVSGSYLSAVNTIRKDIPKGSLYAGNNSIKVRLVSSSPINAVTVSDTEASVKRNY